MNKFLIAATFGLCLSFMGGDAMAQEISFTGMQKYKAGRIEQFLQRLNHSAVKVTMNTDLSTTLSFGNLHIGVVDKHLHDLLSSHPRELPFTSVTYYVTDKRMVSELASYRLLQEAGAHVDVVEKYGRCEVNSFSGCKVYLIQFYATERGR